MVDVSTRTYIFKVPTSCEDRFVMDPFGEENDDQSQSRGGVFGLLPCCDKYKAIESRNWPNLT